MGTISDKIAISIGVTAVAGITIGAIVVSSVNRSKTNLDNDSAYALQSDAERVVEESTYETIDFETHEIEDNSLEYGKTEIRSAGEEGEKTELNFCFFYLNMFNFYGK